MSTIALLVGAGWGVRSFLQSGVMGELEAAGKVLILAHPDLVPTLRERYGACARDRLTIEPLRPFDPSVGAHGRIAHTRNDLFMRLARTVTRAADRAHHRPKGLRGLVEEWLGSVRSMVGGRRRLRALDSAEQQVHDQEHAELSECYRRLFEEHDVRMVVSTTAYLPIETPPVRVARAHGIQTVCWINSWDNLTSKGPLPIPYDAYFVWSLRMATELREYYPESRDRPCAAVGVPHFDGYSQPAALDSREQLCDSVGIDPERPFILYAACTPFLAPDEHLIAERLADDLASGAVLGRPQLLVRLHPADPGTRFAALAERPGVAVDMPGIAREDRPPGIFAFCPDAAENRRALAMVAHANVVVNIASTMSLEAAIADRPTINVAYDLAPGNPHGERIAGYYRYDHYQTVTDSGAVRIVDDPESLIEAIQTYLAAPSLHRTERATLARLWCAAPDHPAVDGRAGTRLGTLLAERFIAGHDA